MTNEQMKSAFLQWIGDNYQQQREKLMKFCSNKHLTFDDDILSDTTLKIAEKILKHSIEDCSEQGFEKYLFKSFKMNVLREQQYSRNARRDSNVTEVGELWEDYCNNTMVTAQEKLLSDLKKDFSAIFILSKVESEFGSSLARLFTLKYYNGLTYKQLNIMHPDFKKLRDTLLNMKRWAIENISKEEIDKAFAKEYADLID